MNNLHKLIAILSACLLITSCYRPDELKIEVQTPQLAGQACADALKSALTKNNGKNMELVKSVEFDFDRRVTIVTYNAKLTALKNIQHSIAQAGFQADHIAPFPGSESKRPQECTEALMEAPPPATPEN